MEPKSAPEITDPEIQVLPPICGLGYFKDISTETCHRCLTGCIQCTSLADCFECDAGFIRNGNKCEAIPNCQIPGSGADELEYHHKCISCPENCAFCNKNTQICSKCKTSFYLKNSKCQPCFDNCKICLDATSCSLCNFGYRLVENVCILKAKSKYSYLQEPNPQKAESENQKQIENYGEKFLTKSSLANCVYEFSENPSMCAICQKGFYLSASSLQCSPCPEGCTLCKNSHFCSACERGMILTYNKSDKSILCRPNVSLTCLQPAK